MTPASDPRQHLSRPRYWNKKTAFQEDVLSFVGKIIHFVAAGLMKELQSTLEGRFDKVLVSSAQIDR